MNLWVFGFCLTGYFVLHSLLADTRIKEQLYLLIPIRYYRLLYNLISIGGLVGLLWMFRQLSVDRLFTVSLWIGGGLIVIGSLLLLLALRNYDLDEFSGTYQFAHNGKTPNHSLNTKGLNAVVRHPLYTASFLLLWGFFLYYPALKSLCFSGIASLYLVIGTRLEEQKLVAVFGEEYLAYMKRVGRFFPKII